MDSGDRPDSGELRQKRMLYYSPDSSAVAPVSPAGTSPVSELPRALDSPVVSADSAATTTVIPLPSSVSTITLVVMAATSAHSVLNSAGEVRQVTRQVVSQGTQTSPPKFLSSQRPSSRPAASSASAAQQGCDFSDGDSPSTSRYEGAWSSYEPPAPRDGDAPSTSRYVDGSSSSGLSTSRYRGAPLTSRYEDGPSTSRPSTSRYEDGPSTSRPSTSRYEDGPSTSRPSTSRYGDGSSTSRPSTSRCGDAPFTSSPLNSRYGDAPSTSGFEGDQDFLVISSDDDDKENQLPPQSQSNARSKVGGNWRELLSSTSSHRGAVDEKPRRQRGRPKGSKNRKTLKQEAACALLDSDSSDEDNPLVKAQVKRPRPESNWREATISTGSLPKRSKGRPKGSKNKQTKAASSPKKGLECHICKDPDDDSALCLTQCGHLFHVHCLEQWVVTSNQKYKTLKVCPYCGSNFEKTVPFFG